jgi:MFS family permease
MRTYRDVLSIRRFRLLWAGDTLSSFGDSVGFLALVWIVYDTAGSATTLGAFVAAYTAPVVLGGPLAGAALDRFDRRRLMLVDNVGRGGVVALVPLLHYAGALRLWHLYVVAVVYGLLRMIPLAGVPSLIPDLVPQERLDAANALETVSFFLSAVVGAGLAGVLIGVLGGPNVLWIDAASYFAFALALWRIGELERPSVEPAKRRARTIREAARFVLATPILLATTLMYMLVNVGEGIVSVVMPVYVREVLAGGPGTYGALVSVAAAAGLVGALGAGAVTPRMPIGRAIALSEIVAGVSYAALAAEPVLALTFVILAAGAFFLGPLTVWAQTIRMSLIPPEMRGRVFGLLRTTMQSTPPLGALLAGPLLAAGGVPLATLAVAAVIAVPAAVALKLNALEFDATPSAEATG